MPDIFDDLYRALTHRLVQVAVVYVGVGAALHRAAWYLGWTWDLPRWLDDASILALAIGFLPVMILAALPGRARSVRADEVGERLTVEGWRVPEDGDQSERRSAGERPLVTGSR